MSSGWITLNRQITDNWLWKDRPFTKGQAWIDILLRVNHKENKIPVNNEIVEVQIGQTIWSIKDMADRWGWSRKKVSNFLNVLQNESMIAQKRTSKYTLLTVVNWGMYQIKEHQKNITGTSTEHQKNTNNNDNNENKKNKGGYTDDFEEFYSIYPRPENKKQTFNSWKKRLKECKADELIRAARLYKQKVTKEGKDKQYITNSSNFLGNKAVYLDYLGECDEEQEQKRKREPFEPEFVYIDETQED